ncbi:MAG TPA: hypothetical protein VF783_04975 [Terriglobales bacterium]
MARAISSGQSQKAEPALALLEAEALTVHLHDVDVVGEPVQQRAASKPFEGGDGMVETVAFSF